MSKKTAKKKKSTKATKTQTVKAQSPKPATAANADGKLSCLDAAAQVLKNGNDSRFKKTDKGRLRPGLTFSKAPIWLNGRRFRWLLALCFRLIPDQPDRVGGILRPADEPRLSRL
jgi:hypothetical protein